MYVDEKQKFVEPQATPACDPFSLDGLEAFWASQPADKEYDWWSGQKCALAQWRDHLNPAGKNYVALLIGAGVKNTVSFECDVTFAQPWTFGAALKRLRSWRSLQAREACGSKASI